MRKRVIAFLLVIMMLFSLMSTMAFAEVNAYAEQKAVAMESNAVAAANYTADDEGPIVSISVEDVYVYEGCGYQRCDVLDWDEVTGEEILSDEYLAYNELPNEITVTFKDGTVFNGSFGELVGEYGDFFAVYCSDQSYDNQWGVGTHSAEIIVMGNVAEYNVIIVESPVASINVEDVYVYEGCGYYCNELLGWDEVTGEEIWSDEYLAYDTWPDDVTITFKDGTVFSGTLDEFGDEYGYEFFDCYTDQSYENQWGLGTHTAEVAVFGKTAEYNIIVLENNVESISVPDVHVKEGYCLMDVDYDEETGIFGEPFNIYDCHPDKLTVNYKDGTSKTYAWDELEKETGVAPESNSINDSYNNGAWGVGTHTTTASYLGASAEFNVIVEETDVKSISVKDRVYQVNTNGEFADDYDEDGNVIGNYFVYNTIPDAITVNYKDGTSKVYTKDELTARFNSEGIDCWGYSTQTSNNEHWSVGNHEVKVFYLGKTTTYNITIVDNTPVKENPFVDVSETAVYYDAVIWASEKEITSGYGNNDFRPQNPCTRAQVVTFLWRAAGCPEPTGDTSIFKDAESIATPFQKAVAWAVEKGITAGFNDGTFRPNDPVTRAQFVTFLWRYEGQPATTGSINGFADAANIATPYQSAVAWAVEKGITTGYNDNTFRPNDVCTRWAVVLFMYRDMA